MVKADVFQWFKLLTKKEFIDFTAFAKIKMKDKSRAALLLSHIKKDFPKFDSKELSYNHLKRHLIPGELVKKITIQNALSDIRIVLKSYLAYLELEYNQDNKELMLLKFYDRKNLSNDFSKQFIRTEKMLANNSTIDVWTHLKRLQLYHQHYFSNNTSQNLSQNILINCLNELTTFTQAAKLRYASEVYNRRNLLKEKFEDLWKLESLESIIFEDEKHYHNLYQSLIKLIRYSTKDGYDSLKLMFSSNSNILSINEEIIIFSYLSNFCSNKIKSGDRNFIKESYKLYRYVFNSKKRLVHEFFNEAHILNAVDLAAELGDYAWAHHIIRNQLDFIPKNKRDYVIEMSLAVLSFKKGEFSKCLDYLIHVELIEPRDTIRGKWLRLKCYYEENNEVSFLRTKVRHLKYFVNNNKVIKNDAKKFYLNSIFAFSLLIQQKSKNVIIDYIDNNPVLSEPWFQKHLNRNNK